MGKTLGINDDYWHGIGAFVGATIINIVGYYILEMVLYRYFGYGNPGLQAFLPMVFSVIFLTPIQWLYERYQEATWPQAYNSLEHFKENSKKDWKWFRYGLMFSIAPYGLFLLIILL